MLLKTLWLRGCRVMMVCCCYCSRSSSKQRAVVAAEGTRAALHMWRMAVLVQGGVLWAYC